jgi:site-specific recombinase XerC
MRPHGKQDWKTELAQIIREHNTRHARKDKTVANLTMHHREQRIFSCFRQLRALGFKLANPRNLAPRHIQALVDLWVTKKLAPGTIQTWLSHLRVFCGWIGKPGMVKSPPTYVADPEYVKRHYAATADKSWSGNNIDVEAMLLKVAEVDKRVANQMLAQLLFGLRMQEAILLKPWRDDAGMALMVSDGTKGGRPRVVPIAHPEQRQALNAFKMQLRHKGASLADPRLTLKAAKERYYTVMDIVGINKKTLGVTSHGLRSEYANQSYREITGELSPIQGGPAMDREQDREARLEIVERLGHSREQVGSAYLGPILRAWKKAGRVNMPAAESGAILADPSSANEPTA